MTLGKKHGGILANVPIVLVAMQRRQIQICNIGHCAEYIPRLKINLRQIILVDVQLYHCPGKGLDISCELRLFHHEAKERSLARD